MFLEEIIKREMNHYLSDRVEIMFVLNIIYLRLKIPCMSVSSMHRIMYNKTSWKIPLYIQRDPKVTIQKKN